MSYYEQYVNQLRTWTSKYHLSFAEIESMPLGLLFDMEVVDSKIDAAFEDKREREQQNKKPTKPAKRKRRLEDYI